jgi:hypothetical protein
VSSEYLVLKSFYYTINNSHHPLYSSFLASDKFGEEDTSGCPKIEGLLKKKNSHGQWKDRYALVSNAYFLTYKPKGKKPSKEMKESIHLKDLEDISIKGDVMHMSLRNGDVLLFQGSNLKDWKHAISVRAEWATDEYQRSLESANAKGVHISGWLMKKSHNKYQGFQVSPSLSSHRHYIHSYWLRFGLY